MRPLFTSESVLDPTSTPLTKKRFVPLSRTHARCVQVFGVTGVEFTPYVIFISPKFQLPPTVPICAVPVSEPNVAMVTPLPKSARVGFAHSSKTQFSDG